jgi:DNA-binding transcriptional ArsR family regulator
VAPAPVDAVFNALADPTRRHLLQALASRDSVTATGLAAELPISRQAVSKHLAALSGADLVRSDRVGRETIYSLRPERLNAAAKWIESVGAEWDSRLGKLRRSLER